MISMNKIVGVAAASLLGESLLLLFQFLPDLLDLPFQCLVSLLGDTPFQQAMAKYLPYLTAPLIGLVCCIAFFMHAAKTTARQEKQASESGPTVG
jgi:hypothetical protein